MAFLANANVGKLANTIVEKLANTDVQILANKIQFQLKNAEVIYVFELVSLLKIQLGHIRLFKRN